jgi:hypothetical protein
MNTQHITRTVTNVVVGVAFWVILFLSLLLRDQVTIEGILFDVGKSLVVAAMLGFLLVVVNDALVKSMIASAKEHKVDRFRGGLSYHLAPPSEEEISWRKHYDKDHPDSREKLRQELLRMKR